MWIWTRSTSNLIPSRQNQQLDLVGGCTAINSRDFENGVVLDPHHPSRAGVGTEHRLCKHEAGQFGS